MANGAGRHVTKPTNSQTNERKIRDRTLSDRAYEDILQMIVNGEFAFGAKLPTEHALSEKLQVSRPVLRQALKQLREDEVIVSRQGSGSFVKRRPDGAVLDFAPVGSIVDIQRTFEFRAAVEGEAAYIAAIRWNDMDLARIVAALDELDRCVRTGEHGVDADEEFHAAVCAATDNQYFVATRNSMKSNIVAGMNLTRNQSLSEPQGHLKQAQKEHSAIFNAIEQRDSEAARHAMHCHVDNARMRIFEATPGTG